jgi:hypothetical protein
LIDEALARARTFPDQDAGQRFLNDVFGFLMAPDQCRGMRRLLGQAVRSLGGEIGEAHQECAEEGVLT